TAKIARSDVPDQVALMFKMVAADAALAGVVGKAALGSAFVQCQYGIGRQCPETHCGNIEDRQGIGLCAARPAYRDAKLFGVGVRRDHGMVDPFVIAMVDVSLGA